MIMTAMREDDKPWKTDLARRSAQRREQVAHEIEEAVKKAASFEDALRQSVEILKKKFSRYSAITAYVADGEDLAVHTSLERPAGPVHELDAEALLELVDDLAHRGLRDPVGVGRPRETLVPGHIAEHLERLELHLSNPSIRSPNVKRFIDEYF